LGYLSGCFMSFSFWLLLGEILLLILPTDKSPLL
jgi:hypothetical protein